MHTQLIISLVSIAAAAAVALACDFLRARNAQLREELDRLAPEAAKRALQDRAGPRRAARRSDRIIATEIQRQTEPAPIDQSTQTRPAEPKSGRLSELIQGLGPISSAPTGPIIIDMRVPAGMHSQAVLSQIMESRQPFTGLVISIGVSAKDPRETRTEDLASSVEQFIAGLLRNSDFGCRIEGQYSPGCQK